MKTKILKEPNTVLFTVRQKRDLIRQMHIYCVSAKPRIFIQDFVENALIKALKEGKM